MTPIDSGTPLDCASAHRLIDAYLVGALGETAAAALREHAADCVACSVELRGFVGLIELVAALPVPVASPDLDERLILAAIADRRRRHEHRSWLRDLPRLVFRGAMRTTGTLVVTLATVALLGSALVFAAGNFFAGTALIHTPGATVAPEVTPTLAPTPQQTPVPTPAPTETQGPVAVSATPAPTPEPTLAPEPTPEPTLAITPTPTVEPTLAPTPMPTDKPRRTPPPSPTDTPAPTAGVTPSP